VIILWRLINVAIDPPVTYWICKSLYNSPTDSVEKIMFIIVVALWGANVFLDDVKRLIEAKS
jgi:hypothetical protein